MQAQLATKVTISGGFLHQDCICRMLGGRHCHAGHRKTQIIALCLVFTGMTSLIFAVSTSFE